MNTIPVGTPVKSKRDYVSVPKGTEGIVCGTYEGGVMVSWNLPDRPIPEDWPLWKLNEMPQVHSKCPLRDGFSYEEFEEGLQILG